jgi:hypothetical protein
MVGRNCTATAPSTHDRASTHDPTHDTHDARTTRTTRALSFVACRRCARSAPDARALALDARCGAPDEHALPSTRRAAHRTPALSPRLAAQTRTRCPAEQALRHAGARTPREGPGRRRVAWMQDVIRWPFTCTAWGWRQDTMLLTIAAIIAIAWLLGFTVFHVASGAIHILIVVAIVVAIVHFVQGRRAPL